MKVKLVKDHGKNLKLILRDSLDFSYVHGAGNSETFNVQVKIKTMNKDTS